MMSSSRIFGGFDSNFTILSLFFNNSCIFFFVSLLQYLLAVLHSSNFGVAMVVPLKGKVVTSKEVLAAGPQPRPVMETAIVTLMHLALHSEKIEFEVFILLPWSRSLTCLNAIFRICKFRSIFKGPY